MMHAADQRQTRRTRARISWLLLLAILASFFPDAQSFHPLPAAAKALILPASYTVTDLGDFGDGTYQAHAYNINNLGEITGFAGGPISGHAFIYRDGTLTDIDERTILPGSLGFDISDEGDITGMYTDNTYTDSVMLYTDGVFINLGRPAGMNEATGQAIVRDAAGKVIIAGQGYYGNRGFTWRDGTFYTPAGLAPGSQGAWYGINETGQIAGWSKDENGKQYATICDGYTSAATCTAISTNVDSQADDINNSGQAVGHWFSGQNGRAFFYDGTTTQTLSAISGDVGNFAWGLNNAGMIVGESVHNSSGSRAVIYDNGTAVNLNSLIPNDSGWDLISAKSINDAGQIVGYGRHNNIEHAFLLNPPRLATSIALSNASGGYGGTTTLSATLTVTAGGALNNRTVKFKLNGAVVGSATTNSNGVATLANVSLGMIGANTYPNGVSATFAGDVDYEPIGGAASLTVTKASQSITFGSLPGRTFGDPPFTVSANATSGLTIGFAALGNCTVSGNTVTLSAAGSCAIVASQSGNANYTAADPVSQSFAITTAPSPSPSPTTSPSPSGSPSPAPSGSPAPDPGFGDLPADSPYRAAVADLVARGVIKGYAAETCAARKLAAPCFGPADPVQRAQAAVMIVRAMGWSNEAAPSKKFPDTGGVDPELQRAIDIAAAHEVIFGFYDGTFFPQGDVLHVQSAIMVSRAMVNAGIWTLQADDPNVYSNIPAISVPNDDRRNEDRRHIATYVHYTGALPDRPTNQPWTDFDQPATREWFAQILYQALQTAR